MILPTKYHLPVLLPEVLNGLKIKKGERYIDATLGVGGYTFEILKWGGEVLGIDTDEDAIRYVKAKLETPKWRPNWKLEEKKNLYLVHGNFADLTRIAKKFGFDKVSGILFDLGMSTYQLEHSGRGFSYMGDEPLDMRMDERQKITASDIINNYTRGELYEIFTKFAEELHSGAIAAAVLRTRTLKGRIERTKTLRAVVEEVLRQVYPGIRQMEFEKVRNGTLARIFQSLRISVNNEIENLKKGLVQAEKLLMQKGRLVVLSYHSLEDRVVKKILKESDQEERLRILTKRPITASYAEIKANPKARSAKLRIAEKYV
ncbi:16S rRNA (cytosine(1402)-N(4))-methyltransferase RsmH [Candidatus Gottesmanbacteria bacterium]|nr:16S rRNA (cytosine(1402)-N(4))-methyltransferase RsmH [Candidatus Gottesmanbacteria bacterium]